MSVHFSNLNGATVKKVNEASLLEDWLEATTTFYVCYNQLTTRIDQWISADSANKKNRYVGQCPSAQLMRLVFTMQIEMKRLVQEMNQFGRNSQHATKDDYQKLAEHTQRLHLLNQQAKLRLQLTAVATS